MESGRVNFKNLLYLILSSFVLVFYQNCEAPKATNPDSSQAAGNSQLTSIIEREGNGAGYTGKVTLILPNSIKANSSYVISIKGGAPPYQIESPSGPIQVINTNGHLFELQNNFGSGVQSFVINVTDSLGTRVSGQIDIVGTDNYYNFSHANSLAMDHNRMFVYDENMKKVIVFDEKGEAMTLLHPNGNMTESFLSNRVFIETFDQGVVVLDPHDNKLHLYSIDYLFVGVVDLAPYGRVVNIFIHQDEIHLVNALDNKIHKLDLNGFYLSDLQLQWGNKTPQYLKAIAIDENRNKIFLADEAAGEIHVFSSNQWIESIPHVEFEDGQIHSFIGIDEIKLGMNGEIFVNDALFLSGSYAGASSQNAGEQWVFALDYTENAQTQKARLLDFKKLTKYYNRTSCLDVFEDSISYCTEKIHIRIVDHNFQKISYIYPREGGYGTGVSEPGSLAVAEDGTYYVVSNYNVVVAIDKNLNILYRKKRYNENDSLLGRVSDMTIRGDRLYAAMSKNKKVEVFDRHTFNKLSEFSVVNQSGQEFSPYKITSTDKYLAIMTASQGFLLYDFSGNLIKHIEGFDEGVIDYPYPSIQGNDFDIGKDEKLYFFDNYRKRVYQYDIAKNLLLSSLQLEKNKTYALVASPNKDQVFMSVHNSVRVYDTNAWTLLGEFGTSGIAPGTFNGIEGMVMDEKFVYVSDFYNQRVQRFSSSLLRSE